MRSCLRQALLNRRSGDCKGDPGGSEETWLAQLEAADMALTAQLNSRDATLSARI